jgi:hypothetical protein
MTQTPREIFKAYCPRCDRAYVSTKSQVAANQRASDHMDKAHPDMINIFKDDE